MYIAKITLDNYKSFSGYNNEIVFNPHLNFFVGNNNTGKSTVLSAINFITEKKARSDVISQSAKDNDYVAVTIIIRGNLNDYILSDDSLKKFSAYIQTDAEGEYMQVQRSSKNEKILQSKKEVELTIEKIRIYNPKTSQYENPSGIDQPFKSFFATQFVWADDMPSDFMDFGSTKICGKLINATASSFFKSPKWQEFETAHKKAFSDGDDSLSSIVNKLASQIEKILKEQYGDTTVGFRFSLPEASGFVKSGDIVLSDDGIETGAISKGTGMQRALALALIQVYSNVSRKVGSSIPLIFLLDEPETFLHPSAQDKLLTALNTISLTNQIFITTHSPYLLKSFDVASHTLHIFSKQKGVSTTDNSQTLSTFGLSSPTWGEINYFAFNIPSVEFHNELYGYVQQKAKRIDPNNHNIEPNFDSYLQSNGCKTTKTWVDDRDPTNPRMVSLQTYIRHFIHHPENKLNPTGYTRIELKESIDELMRLI